MEINPMIGAGSNILRKYPHLNNITNFILTLKKKNGRNFAVTAYRIREYMRKKWAD